jgi:glucose/mannose-6-phosphate isomerase
VNSSTLVIDGDRLNDAETLRASDSGGMLVAIATAAAQLREAVTIAGEAGLDVLADEPRPRALVVTGMGGSGIAGEVLAALAGDRSATPVFVHRGYGLPAWVGPADLVAAVSCSGRTEETLSAAEEALRRGARLVGVGAAGSPLAQRVEAAHGPYVPIDAAGRMPRSLMWALSMPLLVMAERLGLIELPPVVVEAAATRLELEAQRCRPDSETFVNPAKNLALELAGSLPMIWGSTPIASVAATRFMTQLAENAKYPAIAGALPEANHNQVVAFDGPLAGADDADLFRDRVDDAPTFRLRLVLLRDAVEPAQVARRAEASLELAEQRGLRTTVLTADGTAPLERLASLVGVIDFASAYLGLLLGIDPTPIAAIDQLKARLRG